MAALDHLILKVNVLADSVRFYVEVMGFTDAGRDGPFTVIKAGPDCELQLAPWSTPGFEHYAFAVTREELDAIFERLKAAGLGYGPTFDSVGTNTGPGPTLYFNDPNKHLIEIRTYEG